MSENQTVNENTGWRARLSALVPVVIWLGLADSLAVFFWDRVAGTTLDLWLRDLTITLVAGTVLVAAMLILIMLLLAGITALKARVFRRRLGELAHGARDRILWAPAPVVVYIWLRFMLSDCSFAWKTGISAGAVAALFVLIMLGHRVPSSLADRALPPFAAVIVSWAAWFAVGALGRTRFPADVAWGTLLSSGIPVFLIALGWSLRMRSRAIGTAGIVFLALCLGGVWLFLRSPEPREVSAKDEPNVLFIVVDTLRADAAWGEDGAMPGMKKLASGGTYYTRAYTPIPKTQQSVSSFHTGLYPWHTGVRTLHSHLGPDFDTMAEKFERAGYRTVAFVHNPWIDYGMGHEQGFHEYFDHGKLESFFPLLHSSLAVSLVDQTVGRKLGASRFQTNGRIMTDAIVEWLSDRGDEPFFMWVQYFDPHWPYLPPREEVEYDQADAVAAQPCNELGKGHAGRGDMILHLREKTDITQEQVDSARRLYRAESTFDDKLISEVLDTFEGDAPILMVTADHGESLGEHDYHFHHGEFTYDVCLHVPMLLSWPGHVPEGRVVEDPVMTTDILATMAHLTGIDPGKTDGLVFPGLRGGPPAPESRVIPFEGDARTYEMNERVPIEGVKGKWRGVMKDGVKVIAVPHPDGFRYQVYDLNTDPGEVSDLYTGNVRDIEPYLEDMRKMGLKVGDVGDDSAVEPGSFDNLSETEKDRLRALGYMQ